MEESHFGIDGSKLAETCDFSASDDTTAVFRDIRETIWRAAGRCGTEKTDSYCLTGLLTGGRGRSGVIWLERRADSETH